MFHVLLDSLPWEFRLGILMALFCVAGQMFYHTRGQDRAWESLPPGLSIKESLIPNAGLGVMALKTILAWTQLGPVLGDVVTKRRNAFKSGYSWKVREKTGLDLCN